MVAAKLTYCFPAFRDRLHVRQIQPGHKGEIRGRKIGRASCVEKRTLRDSAEQLWAMLSDGCGFSRSSPVQEPEVKTRYILNKPQALV